MIQADEKVELSRAEDEEDDRCHDVHLDCHIRPPRPEFVTSMCGIALDWEERNDDPETQNPPCPDCKKSTRCPRCGLWKPRYGGTR